MCYTKLRPNYSIYMFREYVSKVEASKIFDLSTVLRHSCRRASPATLPWSCVKNSNEICWESSTYIERGEGLDPPNQKRSENMWNTTDTLKTKSWKLKMMISKRAKEAYSMNYSMKITGAHSVPFSSKHMDSHFSGGPCSRSMWA